MIIRRVSTLAGKYAEQYIDNQWVRIWDWEDSLYAENEFRHTAPMIHKFISKLT